MREESNTFRRADILCNYLLDINFKDICFTLMFRFQRKGIIFLNTINHLLSMIHRHIIALSDVYKIDLKHKIKGNQFAIVYNAKYVLFQML